MLLLKKDSFSVISFRLKARTVKLTLSVFFFLFFLFPVSVPGFTPSVLSSPEESSAMPEEPVPSSGRGE